MLLRRLVMRSREHFEGLNFICQSRDHLVRVSRSSWRNAASFSDLMCRYMRQSSANNLINDKMLVAMSLMNNMNRSGPNTVPWGTSESTVESDDLSPSTTTAWVRLVSQFSIQVWVDPWIPYHPSLYRTLLWATTSNALEKSSIKQSICCLSSMPLLRSSKVANSWVSQLCLRNPCWKSFRMSCWSRWARTSLGRNHWQEWA